MEKKPVTTTNIRTNPETIESLDYFASKMGLSRNQLMHNLLVIGVDDLKTLDKLGMIRLGVGIRTMMEKLHEPNQQMLFD